MEEQANAYLKQKDYDRAIIQYQKIIEIGGDQDVYEKKIGDARKAKRSSSTDKKKVTYTVKSGDSLWTIAKKYPGVSDKDIMKWNNCNENLRPGQKLIIYPKK
jgi:LysM repeat protein